VTGTLLVSWEDKVKVRRVVDGIEDGEDGATWVTEDVLDAMTKHHLVDDGASGLTNEGIIETGLIAMLS
jgi:hypothetical protein